MCMKKQQKIRYYTDELIDDFGNPNHTRADVFHSFNYKRGGFPGFFDNMFYYCFAVPYLAMQARFCGYRIVGKNNLKMLKHYVKTNKKGFFVMQNHAGIFDVIENLMLGYPYRVNTVGNSDPLSMPVIRHLVRSLGFVPLPTNIKDLPAFQEILRFYVVDQCQGVSIFPEAHLWPGYTGVRNFKRSSFRYPARFQCPVLPVFCQRRPRSKFVKFLHLRPRVTVYAGSLIYPDANLDFKQNEKIMGDACYNFMKTITETMPHEDNYKYVYAPKNEKEEEK